jgi:hypothetical protein
MNTIAFGQPMAGNHLIGITNRNPFNLVQFSVADPWFGSVAPFRDNVNGHAMFGEREYAVCAFCRHLWRSQWMPADSVPALTVGELLAEQAPAGHAGNDPGAYGRFVAEMLRIGVGDVMVFHDRAGNVRWDGQLRRYLRAVAEWEIFRGYEISEETIANGIRMYHWRLGLGKYTVRPTVGKRKKRL